VKLHLAACRIRGPTTEGINKMKWLCWNGRKVEIMRGEGWRIATSLMSRFPSTLLRPTCVSECVSLFLIPAEMRMLLVMMYYTG